MFFRFKNQNNRYLLNESYFVSCMVSKIQLKMRQSLFWFLIAGMLLLTACHSVTNDPFDVVKKYHPDDPYFKAAMVSLHFIIETTYGPEVDTTMVMLIDNYQLPTDASGAADGVYMGISPYDAYDYAHVVELTIEGGKIVKVDYDEVHRNGNGKQDDKEYNKHMLENGTNPSIAYPLYESQLLNNQNIWGVDAVSGATSSLYRFRFAVIVALMQAQESAAD